MEFKKIHMPATCFKIIVLTFQKQQSHKAILVQLVLGMEC